MRIRQAARAPGLATRSREHHAKRSDRLGIAIQAYLRRTAADIEPLVAMGAVIRLLKGTYLEAANVALPNKADVDGQDELAKAGVSVRGLISYGEYWFPWCVRRLRRTSRQRLVRRQEPLRVRVAGGGRDAPFERVDSR